MTAQIIAGYGQPQAMSDESSNGDERNDVKAERLRGMTVRMGDKSGPARPAHVPWSDLITIGRMKMRKLIIGLTAASALSLGACASNPNVAQDAGIGAVGGAAIGAVVPGVSVIEGAAVGAAIGGLSGAIWSDSNNDGYVDGYVSNGQYYQGTPQGYDPTIRGVATGAIGGAALGAAAGALIPGLSILQGAVIGAAVGGLAGAIWADSNNDGRVDGYMYNGQYYQGGPAQPAPSAAPTYSAPASSGERG